MLVSGESVSVWRSLPLVLVIAAACSVSNAGEPSAPPTLEPAAVASVPPGPVVFQPEQLIFPAEDFPLAAKVTADRSLPDRAWERGFSTEGSPDFVWFTVRVYVLDPDVAPGDFVLRNGCGTVTWTTAEPTATQLSAPDDAKACAYHFPDGERVIYYAAGFRNVGILVSTQPRRIAVSDQLAGEWVGAIAREQVAIIGRVLTAHAPPAIVGGYEQQP